MLARTSTVLLRPLLFLTLVPLAASAQSGDLRRTVAAGEVLGRAYPVALAVRTYRDSTGAWPPLDAVAAPGLHPLSFALHGDTLVVEFEADPFSAGETWVLAFDATWGVLRMPPESGAVCQLQWEGQLTRGAVTREDWGRIELAEARSRVEVCRFE